VGIEAEVRDLVLAVDRLRAVPVTRMRNAGERANAPARGGIAGREGEEEADRQRVAQELVLGVERAALLDEPDLGLERAVAPAQDRVLDRAVDSRELRFDRELSPEELAPDRIDPGPCVALHELDIALLVRGHDERIAARVVARRVERLDAIGLI